MVRASEKDRNIFLNLLPQYRLERYVSFRKGKKKTNRYDVEATVFRHGDFPDKELYAVPRFYKTYEEGSSTKFLLIERKNEMKIWIRSLK